MQRRTRAQSRALHAADATFARCRHRPRHHDQIACLEPTHLAVGAARVSLLRQSRAYLLVGALQWLLDCGLTIGLSVAGLLSIEAANFCGRAAGAALGFWLNGRITFAAPGHRLGPAQFRRFLLMWAGTTALSTALMAAAEDLFGLRGAWSAKPLIEVALAALGFVLSRQWVYRR